MGKSRLVMGDCEACKDPVLSILIPTFRTSEYLLQAIDSALRQNSSLRYEVVVVSNDPDNPLSEVRERYRGESRLLVYQNTENIGMVGNSNRCAELARGEYIAFLHDDDYLLDNYLDVVERYIIGHPERECLITGRYMEFEGAPSGSLKLKKILREIYFIPDLYRKKLRTISLRDCLRTGTNIYFSPSCGTVIRKESFERIGGFDSSIAYSFDLDFFLRLNASCKIYETTEICAVYRMGDNASLKSGVKYDFFEYFQGRFLDIMRLNAVDNDYIRAHEKELIYMVYRQLGSDLDAEFAQRGKSVEKVGPLRMLLYQMKKTMYFYNHNLDIQRLR